MEYGVCPVCNGSGKVALTDEDKKWSWNRDRTHKECGNCGGQYMSGTGTGKVRLDKDGKPCVHKYVSRNAGRCLTEYTCENCGDKFHIDSSD